MATSVLANWHGHDYQARYFWIEASRLKNPQQDFVVEVSYEADGPKAFDDVITRYNPPRRSTGPDRIQADYYQIKFHVTQAASFGYEDLIDPAFIGAETFSILERLKQAKGTEPANSAFHLVTTDRIIDEDPLGEIISNVDGSIRLDKLFDGTTDRSRKGKVRKLWRQHLKLSTDQELEQVLSGFHIQQSQPTLEAMREKVNTSFQIIGLITCETSSEFRFDGAARALRSQERYRFTREQFTALCVEENWIRSEAPESFRNVALRSFSDGPLDSMDALPEHTLSLLSLFEGRFPSPGIEWNDVIKPQVETFLTGIRQTERKVRLYLNTHSSIALLAGKFLGHKSGVEIELVQKGRSGDSIWSEYEPHNEPAAVIEIETVGTGRDVAVVLSMARNALPKAHSYILANQPDIGRIIHVTPANGYGQRSVKNGSHAVALAEQISDAVTDADLPVEASLHIFSAAPNAVNFYLGQHTDFLGTCVFYEFDFQRQRDGSYLPSFKV
ncbi:SAVED domain-containing protein [Pseudescherichia vulneris]|uniref:CBASS system CD-NTase-associated protein Cap4 n=1 Tax=Pseudescherichia vulneris TaxID=566 RepID=UPI001EE01652|nr:SAVED domain-containing protein [Pseudescherichia vulneris]